MEEHMHFLVEQKGDLERYLHEDREGPVDVFHSLEEALGFIEETISPDIEDDRILVWEVSPGGIKRVVWHFSGWHWDQDCKDFVYEGLEQGKLLGHSETLATEIQREVDSE